MGRFLLQIPRVVGLSIIIAVLVAGANAQALDTPTPAPAENVTGSYVLGPNDQIMIRVLDADEFGDRPYRIDNDGFVSLPMLGRVSIGGMTIQKVEEVLRSRLTQFMRDPHATVTVTEFRSQPISIIGSVNAPGVHQIQGKKTLIEALSLANGLRADAGPTLKLTRQKQWGPIPLRHATYVADGFSVVEVDLKELMEAKIPEQNIDIRPFDVISVPRAELVYVVGEIRKPGGFTLSSKDSMSVLQALAMAEGSLRTAAPKHAKILRTDPVSKNRNEIPVDLTKIMDGRAPDIAMVPNDVLFVPNNVPKNAALRILETAIQTGTGIMIYRR